MTKLSYAFAAAAACLVAASPASAQIATTSNNSAAQLATALQGSGVVFTSATLNTTTQNGTFSNGAAATGIANGVVLTTGSLSCVGATNTSNNCSGAGTGSTLTLGFTATSNNLFFNYVFGSEEYNEYVGSAFNDTFSLTLTGANYAGVNLAQLPGNGGVVSINNVNANSNSAYFRNNSPGSIPIELDGLTTVLTAGANNLVIGSNYTLTFAISDVGDADLDSAVFIQGGSVGTVTPPTAAVPEPATWAMMICGFGMVAGSLRRRQKVAARIRFA